MRNKINHVRNPLTIIAIFAGISEISATAVLPFISESIQKVFIWFIILFPFVLLILFFITLWTKHQVLYAPSDYKSDENFLKVIPSTGFEIKKKLIEDTKELVEDSNKVIEKEKDSKDMKTPIIKETAYDYENPGFDVGAHENFALAEQLYLNKLKDQYNGNFNSQSTIQSGKLKIKVDGLSMSDDHWYLHEIKYFSSVNIQMNGIGRNIKTFKQFCSNSTLNKKLTYHLHIVTPVDPESRKKIEQIFYNNFGDSEDIYLEVIDYLALRKEYNFD